MGIFYDAAVAVGNAVGTTGNAVGGAARATGKGVVYAAKATGSAVVNTSGDAVGSVGAWLSTPKDTDSPEFKKRQAIREYNALLDRTDPSEPKECACIKCLAAGKAGRRNARHKLIDKATISTLDEKDPIKRKKILDAADRLGSDMDRVEDAKLALYTYTANERPESQPEFLKQLDDQPPPGFKNASIDQVAKDFGVDRGELKDIISSEDNPTQKIMIFERDPNVLGQPPKYTVAFRGSTTDKRDWNNNSKNELGYEAPHQKNAARLGQFLKDGDSEEPIGSLISTTGHSKGGSEAQAFAAASGSGARVFNPAGFDPKQYAETSGVTPDQMHIDRTTVIARDAKGKEIKEKTDPLYYAQNRGITQYTVVRKKPITSGPPRELDYIEPSVPLPPGAKESDSEAHSMLQVIEGLERDKKADEDTLTNFVSPAAGAGTKP